MKKTVILLSIFSALMSGCISQNIENTSTSANYHRNSEQMFDDAAINTKVKASYINNKLMGGNNLFVSNIRINTINNVVYLSGTVDTQEQADNAIKLAKAVRNVKQVVSSITVTR